MAFLSLSEVIDITMMTAFVGFIFGDVFKGARQVVVDTQGQAIPSYSAQSRRMNLENFKFAIIVTAPAIILHEFGHKIVAIMFGMRATFNAAYGWLSLGLVLKLIGFPFVFFVPAYVSIVGNTTPFNYSLIAFAGPAVNLLLWLSSWAVLEYFKRLPSKRGLSTRTKAILILTKQINMFLFIFNMLPIPGFDGSKVYSGLLSGI